MKQRRQKTNKRLERFSATFLGLAMLFLLQISMVSALEMDNSKTYDENLKVVTITNAYGLGDVIGQAKLISPLVVQVPRGYQKVAEFDIWVYQDYNDALKQLYFEDLNKGRTKINRNYDLKMLEYKEVTVPVYENTDCSTYYDEGDEIWRTECDEVQVGTTTEIQEVWTKVSPADLKKNEVVRIGVFTDVQEGDFVDWIPTIFGVQVPEWAAWSESIYANIESYYKLDEPNGQAEDATGNKTNGTSIGITYGNPGIINDAYTFGGGTTDRVDLNYYLSGKTAFTINMWIYPTSTLATTTYRAFNSEGSNTGIDMSFSSGKLFTRRGDGSSLDGHLSTFDFSGLTNEWFMITLTWDDASNNIKSYINGQPNGTTNDAGSMSWGTTNFKLGNRQLNDRGFPGRIDGLGIWSRQLGDAEVLEIYDAGVAGDEFSPGVGPEVTLTSPTADEFLNSSSVDFELTATDAVGMSSVKLYIDGVLNETNSSAVNGSYTFSKVISEGLHNWYIVAENNNTLTTTSPTRNFTIDITSPTVTLTSPTGAFEYLETGDNITINWTATDTYLEDCYYSYPTAANITDVSCTLNTTTDTYSAGFNSVTLYANDTAGNIGADTTSFTVSIAGDAWFYPTTSLEGSIDAWQLNITTDGSVSPDSADLIYNGTTQTGSINQYGTNQYTLSATNYAPSVDAATNYTAYFSITLDDSSVVNTTVQTQLVNNLGVDDCSSYTNVLYNFTIYDEKTKALINGTAKNSSGELNLQLSDVLTGTQIVNFNNSYDDENPFAVCLDNNLSLDDSYYLDLELAYSADDYAKEFYYIIRDTLDNDDLNTQISLYLLDNITAQPYKITYKDKNFLPVSGVFQLQRKYLDEGIYRTVEQPKMDSKGEVIVQVELEDAVYTVNIISGGTITATFSDIRFYCPNPTIESCEDELNSFQTSGGVVDYETLNGVTFSFNYNDSSRTVSAPFAVTTGTSKSMGLNVFLYDAFGNTSICNDTLVSSGGTLSCIVPSSFGNATVIAKLSDSGETFAQTTIRLDAWGQEQYGFSIVIIGIVSVLLLIMIGLSPGEPLLYGVFLIIGTIFLGTLNIIFSTSWLGAGATLLWFMLAVLLIVIKGGDR